MQVIKFSVVAACYNSALYIDDFFEALFNQSIGYKSLEIVAVDDGSTDDTAKKIAHWSNRFPGTIKYIHQKNAGQASARNSGLRIATGDWVSFIDPDDFVSDNYLEEVRKEIAANDTSNLCFIACNIVFFYEEQRTLSDSHLLNFKFKAHRTECKVKDIGDRIQLHINACWVRLKTVKRMRLAFDPKIRPTFEDAAFCVKYLLSNMERKIVYLKAPKYFYRKRRSKDSSVDGALTSAGYYTGELHFGHLKLMRYCKSRFGTVPNFVQSTVLYTLVFRFHYLLNQPNRLSFLTTTQRNFFESTLRSLFKEIQPGTIQNFKLANFDIRDRIGLMGIFKETSLADTVVKLEQVEESKGLFQFSHLSRTATCQVQALCNGKAVELIYSSKVEDRFLDRPYCNKHYFWIRVPDNTVASFGLGSQLLGIEIQGRRYPPLTTARKLVWASKPAFRQSFNTLSHDDRDVRRNATSTEMVAKYQESWIFLDRKQHASDNAEHLYRYVSKLPNPPNCIFALNRSSDDWDRLSKAGFNLVAIGSREYFGVIANCKFLLSSHMHDMPQKIEDLVGFRYIFLQHGVIKDDLSGWLNRYAISLFCTTTPAEHASIASSNSNYRFSAKEVVLTGLPRHDQLRRLKKTTDTILIMPTWRQNLQYLSEEAFCKSRLYRCWMKFLESPALYKLAAKHDLEVVFMLHPNLSNYINLFRTRKTKFRTRDMRFLQTEMARSKLLVTDYSSVAFDVAYVDKPVSYYQFDLKEFRSGSHVNAREGYFDYRKHGFGPVARNEKTLLKNLKTILSGNEDPIYNQRRLNAFPYKDGKCCERVYQSVLKL
ncbi:MAG TPA: CDP-glycerol glycerophosphotransferase family protein [Chlamydiales bacterium]|nr:CDP-glycerol glycerophosphotransferase family protein [Chlamydiales bacterium]